MVRSETLRTGFFVLLLLLFGYLLLLIARPFATAILAALLLAVLLSPGQRRLAPRIGEKPAALALVTVAVGAVGAVIGIFVVAAPEWLSDPTETLNGVSEPSEAERQIEEVLGIDVPLGSIVDSVPRRVSELLLGDISGIVSTTTDLFLGAVLFLFVLYYLLVDGDRLIAWIEDRLPLDDETTERLHEEARRTTWAVLKGHILVAVVQGAVAGVGLFVVGVPNVLFWSFVMMVLELFPVIGVAGVLGPAVLWLFLEERVISAVFLLAYGATAVAVVDDYLRAHVVDRESSLHSAAILVGVFGGVYAFGVMGLFYGPIVVGLFKTLVQVFDERHVDDG